MPLLGVPGQTFLEGTLKHEPILLEQLGKINGRDWNYLFSGKFLRKGFAGGGKKSFDDSFLVSG